MVSTLLTPLPVSCPLTTPLHYNKIVTALNNDDEHSFCCCCFVCFLTSLGCLVSESTDFYSAAAKKLSIVTAQGAYGYGSTYAISNLVFVRPVSDRWNSDKRLQNAGCFERNSNPRVKEWNGNWLNFHSPVTVISGRRLCGYCGETVWPSGEALSW